MGSAIDYVRRIYKDFDNAGYYCQHFLLDASKMGVPQKRERIFLYNPQKHHKLQTK
jgi:DNA (cytosine-5)-methyltransferase 1